MKLLHKQPPRRLVNDSGVPGALMRPAYNMDAAARVAYESFVQQLGLKIGEKVDDDKGVHRIPSWDDHKTFVKARWRTVAQAVIDAATGVQRKVALTSAPDVRGLPDGKGSSGGGDNGQGIQVRRRQSTKRRAVGCAPKRPTRSLDKT